MEMDTSWLPSCVQFFQARRLWVQCPRCLRCYNWHVRCQCTCQFILSLWEYISIDKVDQSEKSKCYLVIALWLFIPCDQSQRPSQTRVVTCDNLKKKLHFNYILFLNFQWDKGEIPNILMDYPSYVGCALSALLCLISAVMLVYLRWANTFSCQ